MKLILFAMGMQILLSSNAYSCNLSYRGVLGKEDQMIGLIKNDDSDASLFVRVGENIEGCDGKVLGIRRNKIDVLLGRNTFVLTPQGSENKKDAGISDLKKSDELDLAEFEENLFPKLVESGQALVDDGVISKEELNRMISEEKVAIEYLKKVDGMLKERIRN